MPIAEYEAFVSAWEKRDRTAALRNAAIIAAIMNKPVYGYEAPQPVTAAELIEGAGNGATTPEDTMQFFEVMAAEQENRKAARSG